jgi:hypothetical protein
MSNVRAAIKYPIKDKNLNLQIRDIINKVNALMETVEDKMITENLKIVDAGSTGATEQDWIEVEVGGITGYVRVYASK